VDLNNHIGVPPHRKKREPLIVSKKIKIIQKEKL
jgi:hypothetical protein